ALQEALLLLFHSERGHGDASIKELFQTNYAEEKFIVPDTKNKNERFAFFAGTEFSFKEDAKHLRSYCLNFSHTIKQKFKHCCISNDSLITQARTK
ncbi:unnamed protein product, partial [Porites lobata]